MEKDPENWSFRFQNFEEDHHEYPEETRGTKVTVTKLFPDVKDTFIRKLEITRLIEELQSEHLYSIDQGLRITVNEGSP